MHLKVPSSQAPAGRRRGAYGDADARPRSRLVGKAGASTGVAAAVIAKRTALATSRGTSGEAEMRPASRYTASTAVANAGLRHAAVPQRTNRVDRPGRMNAVVATRTRPSGTNCRHSRHRALPVGARSMAWTFGRALNVISSKTARMVLFWCAYRHARALAPAAFDRRAHPPRSASTGTRRSPYGPRGLRIRRLDIVQ
jgi:hypothetical protein